MKHPLDLLPFVPILFRDFSRSQQSTFLCRIEMKLDRVRSRYEPVIDELSERFDEGYGS